MSKTKYHERLAIKFNDPKKAPKTWSILKTFVNGSKILLIPPHRGSYHDRFRVDIYSAHVLISITFAVFEYLDTALATENKILTFSTAVLPYKMGSSNVNLALMLFFCGHTSYKRVS